MSWLLLFLLLPVAFYSGWRLGLRPQMTARAEACHPNYLVGFNYALNEQPDQAVDTFLQLLEQNDNLIEVHLALGSLFRRRGEVDRATRLHQALLARPTLPRWLQAIALLELARDYMKAGWLDRAEALLLELCSMTEHRVTSLKYLLDIYQQEKEWAKSIEIAKQLSLEQQVDTQREIAHGFCELAQIALSEQNSPQAIKSLKQALKAYPDCARATIMLGQQAWQKGKVRTAVRLFEQVRKQNPDYFAELVPTIGACYQRLNRPERMLALLEACLAEPCNNQIILSFAEWLNRERGPQFTTEFLSHRLRERPTLQGLNQLVIINKSRTTGFVLRHLEMLQQQLENLIANTPTYRCSHCGLACRVQRWHCPGCRQWETIRACD